MRSEPYRPSRIDAGHRRLEKELLLAGKHALRTRWTAFRKLRAFVRKNPRLRQSTPDKIRIAFAVDMLRWGNRGGTVVSCLEALKGLPVSSGMTACRARLHELSILKGIEICKAKREPVYKHKPLVSTGTLQRLVADDPHKPRKDVDLRAFWYLCVATGNRPGDIAKARLKKVTRSHLHIRWNGRKRDQHGKQKDMVYPMAWTFPPSKEVAKRLGRLSQEPTVRRKAEANHAACLNSWLKRRGKTWTSGCARVHLANRLIPEVEAGRLHQSRYELMLNHSFKVALATYRRDKKPLSKKRRVSK